MYRNENIKHKCYKLNKLLFLQAIWDWSKICRGIARVFLNFIEALLQQNKSPLVVNEETRLVVKILEDIILSN